MIMIFLVWIYNSIFVLIGGENVEIIHRMRSEIHFHYNTSLNIIILFSSDQRNVSKVHVQK